MKKIASIFILAATSMAVMAVPARHGGRTVTQPDGSEVVVYQHGDESFHYMTNAQGEWLKQDAAGYYRVTEGLSDEAIAAKRQQSKFARRATNTTGADRLLATRGLIILVSFQDTLFQNSLADMTDWAMGENYTYNGATGSIHQYFYDNSWGQYDLQLDVIGPVQVSKSAAYYGQNRNGTDGADMHPNEMVVEACRLADQQGVDFSQYDSNNDGYVDWVVIVYAGYGEADSYIANTIWPHQHDLAYTGSTIQLDGKTVNHYCCLNELDGWNGMRCGIGTFCHEFSHIMGLPDLYTTNYTDHKTCGSWDIMDYGCYNNDGNTPPMYSAYERWWMGWMTPELLNEAATVNLQELNRGKQAAYLTANGSGISNILMPLPSTFYLLENRQQTGWDSYLPGHGLMITKVQWNYSKWTQNTVNNTASSMGVDILEADGLTPMYNSSNRTNGYFGKQGDLYPTESVNTFTQVTNYPLTEITETGTVVSFKVNGGGEQIALGVEQTQSEAVESRKILRNGQLYIQRNGTLYDINGRKL